MSLYTLPQPTLALLRDHRDGRCALTNPASFYPTSDARLEHYVRPSPSMLPRPAPSAPSTSTRALDKYPLPDLREVCPGVLASTGQLTENHPLVDTYLEALARVIPREPSKVAASSTSSPVHLGAQLLANSATHSTSATVPAAPRAITFWQAEHAGIASWNTVSNVIRQQFILFPDETSRLYEKEVPRLTTAQQQAIFTLAALKVLNHPTHPAHFAFWAKNNIMRTADTVDAVIQLKPCPIESRVGWIGKQENVWALRGLQSLYVPPEPKGMTLRKRKAPSAPTATSSELAEVQVEARVNTRKRTRTTRASQKAKDAEAAQAAAPIPDATEDADAADTAEQVEEQGSSLLFASGGDVAAPPFPSVQTLEFITRAVKEDLITGSPVLQAIEQMLGLKQPADIPLDLPPPAISPDSAPTASPSATRRSTRARRKPAPPGPCSLLSTPLSSLSSPPSPAMSASPLDSPEKSARSRSRGSSTAVSDADCPSEDGTVVDVEIEAAAASKGKRKAVEIEEMTVVELEESAQTQVPKSGAKAKKPSPSARKRARTDKAKPLVATDVTVPEKADTILAPDASGEENVPELPSEPIATAAAKKRKTAASGGKRKPARARV